MYDSLPGKLNVSNRIQRQLSREELILILTSVCIQSVAHIYNLFINSRPIIGLDALIFQYSGWYITQGEFVYSGTWDIKPPFIHYLASVISLIAGGNMFLLHFISTIVMGSAFLLIVLLIYRIVSNITGNNKAAFISSLFLFTFPPFYNFSVRGLRPKMFVILFGLVMIWYLLRGRFGISTIFGAVAAGFWQFAIIFAIIPFVYIIHYKNWKQFKIMTVGVSTLLLISIAPVIYVGATNQLIAEVILGPFLASEALNYPFRIIKVGYVLKFASIPLAIGGLGILVAVYEDEYGNLLWLLILGGWFLVQVLFLDFDGSPDLFVGFAIVAIGFGIAVDNWSTYENVSLFGVVAIVALMFGWFIYVLSTGNTFLWAGFSNALVTEPTKYYSGNNNLYQFYWDQITTTNCHLRLSGPEKEFMKITGETIRTSQCGKYDLYHLFRVILS